MVLGVDLPVLAPEDKVSFPRFFLHYFFTFYNNVYNYFSFFSLFFLFIGACEK